MDHDEIISFIEEASSEQFIALRNKIYELNNVTLEGFVLTLDKLIDLII